MKKRIVSGVLATLLLTAISLPLFKTKEASASYIKSSDIPSVNKLVINDSGTLTFTPQEGGAFNLSPNGSAYSGNATSVVTFDGVEQDAFWINKTNLTGCYSDGITFEVFNFSSGYGISNLDSDLGSADGDPMAGGVAGKFNSLKTANSITSPTDNRNATNAILLCNGYDGSSISSYSNYAVFTIASSSSGGGAPNPSTGGGTGSGAASWYDSKGVAVTTFQPERFKFNSPIEMVDTTTSTYYVASGYPRMQGGDSDNNSLFADGAIWLKPTGSDKKTAIEKTTDGRCLGIIAATFVSGDDDDKYGKVHFLPPTLNSQQVCTIDQSPISGLSGFVESGATLWNFISNQQDVYDKTESFSSDAIAPLMASHYWANKDTLKTVGREVSLSKITSADSRYSVLMSKLGLALDQSNYEFWTTPACTEGKNTTDAFSVIYFKQETTGSSRTSATTAFNYRYAHILMAHSTSSADNEFGSTEFDGTWSNNEGGYIKCLLGINVDKAPLAQAAHNSLKGNTSLLPMAYTKFATMTQDEVAQDGGLPENLTANPVDPEGNEASQSCEDLAGDFGVIACWILKGVDGFLGLIENIISSQLEVSSDLYSVNGSNEGGLYDAWRSVARIASALIAIIALIMVAGTALGDYKAFSSYTVKKVLPRLVIASIAIWLSWPIATSYINLMNVLGKGVADLLWTPFANNGAGNFNDWGLASAMKGQSGVSQALTNFSVIGGLATAGLAAGVAVATGGPFALLSSLVPVLVFMLVGFAVLVLRKALIIFLLVLAPVAIAAWVLPNTESMWKKWSKLFNQLLIMFPLFMGVLAAGKIFSYITWKSGGNDFLSILISVIGYITPFVLLPGIFKSAGGALSKVTGALNKQGSKYGGKLSGAADKQAKIRKDALTSNNRLNALKNIGNGGRGGLGGFMDRRRVGMPIGVGFRSGTKEALSSQRERIEAAGQSEYKKAQKELVDKQLDNLRSSNADERQLKALATNLSTPSHMRQAAVERLMETRNDGAVRELMKGGHAKEEFKTAINNGSLRSAFGDSAPDIGKARVNGTGAIEMGDSLTAGKLPDASTVAGWTGKTLEEALNGGDANVQRIVEFLENDPDFASRMTDDKLNKILTAHATSPRAATPITIARKVKA